MCKYCNENEDIFINQINKTAIIKNNKLIVEMYEGSLFRTIVTRVEVPIECCPKCGKKLKGEKK